jgi:GNAT superfamily N-acetyltransferase
VLAFASEAPIGWCSIAPRTDFPRLDRSKALAAGVERNAWSLNYLFIPARTRGRGVARALVAAAIDLCNRDRGLHAALKRGERRAGALVWTRVRALLERLGFRPLAPAERGRTL